MDYMGPHQAMVSNRHSAEAMHGISTSRLLGGAQRLVTNTSDLGSTQAKATLGSLTSCSIVLCKEGCVRLQAMLRRAGLLC